MFNCAVINAGPLVALSLQSADWLVRVRVSPIPDPLLVMELAGFAQRRLLYG